MTTIVGKNNKRVYYFMLFLLRQSLIKVPNLNNPKILIESHKTWKKSQLKNKHLQHVLLLQIFTTTIT